jgi:PAS domain S-box-containing protein
MSFSIVLEDHKMNDKDETKKQLMEELEQLRLRVTELEAFETRYIAADKALEQAEQEKQTILDSLVEHVVYHDLEFRVLWANRAACDSVGIAREELLGRHCYQIWANSSEPCEDCPVQLARQTGQPQAIEKTTPDGRSWYIQASSVRDGNGDIVGMVELTLDITERKRTEEELRQSEELYRQLVETMNEGLAFADKDYILTFFNERFCEMLGYSKEEMVGRHLIEFIHDDYKEFMKDQMARRRRGEQEKFEFAWSAKDGRKIYTIASPRGIFDAEGNFTGSLAVLTDITVRRQLEEELRTAQLKAKRELKKLVEERTAELVEVNEQLKEEIKQRKRVEGAQRESEIRYRSLFDNMGDGVAIYEAVNGGEDFILVDFNKAAELIDKIQKKSVIGKSVLEVFPGVRDFGLFELFQRVWRTGRSAYHPIGTYKDDRIEGWRDNFVYKLPSGELVAVYSDETVRKQAENALLESEATARALLNAPTDLVMLLDTRGVFLDVNEATARRFNRSVDELTGMCAWDLFEAEVVERRKGAVDKVIETVKSFQFEEERQGRCWDTVVYPVLDSGGSVTRVAVVARDITERKLAVTALQEISAEQEVLLGTVPAMIFWIDNEGRFLRVNNFFAAALHKSPDDIRGKSLFDLYPEDMATKYYEDNAQVMESGAPKRNIEEPVRTPDGIMWVLTHKIPYTDEMGNTLGVIGFAIDVTERKLALEQLRESEERYRSLVDYIGVGVSLISPDMEVLTLNNKMKEWFPDIDPAARPLCYRVFNDPPGEEVCSYCPTIKALQDGEVHEVTTETPAGDQIRNYKVISSPIRDNEGQIVAAIEMVDDITEDKQKEVELQRLTQELIKVQEVERQRLAADLHDHLAQDLAFLKIGLDTLAADQPDAPDERRQRVFELSKLVQNSVMKIRDVAYGLHPSGLKEFGLVYAARQYCEEFAGKNGLTFDFFSVGMDEPKLDFDTEIALYRMIQEGLANVKKHAHASHVNVRLSATVSHIMLHIEDNGKGFEVDNRLTAALGEKRMGIWGMEQRVTFLNGEMKIESGPMDGTRILIRVPYMDKTNG